MKRLNSWLAFLAPHVAHVAIAFFSCVFGMSIVLSSFGLPPDLVHSQVVNDSIAVFLILVFLVSLALEAIGKLLDRYPARKPAPVQPKKKEVQA